MAKKPRPSINDQLAALASARQLEPSAPADRSAQSPANDPPSTRKSLLGRRSAWLEGVGPKDVQEPNSTLPRDHVETGKLERDHVSSLDSERDNVVTSPRDEGPDGFKRRVRFEKPHASVYAHPKVFKALREIAAAEDCKPHDLYLEGLRLVLRAYGRDFDALNRGE